MSDKVTKAEMMAWLSGMVWEDVEVREIQICNAVRSLVKASDVPLPINTSRLEVSETADEQKE